ncbi:MAG: aldehyde dehydrogenase (NADP(+)) [Crocinitomicaceae bacterium]|nr:aldehyde dehydrogenase (NADP(+)) [Crocinitomicaceae bacterium]
MITGKNYIGSQLKDSNNQITFRTFDPVANSENDWVFYEATEDEINEACRLALMSFKEFQNTSDQIRAQFLRDIADNIEVLGETLLEVYQKESGLDLVRARAERARTTYQLRMFADFIETSGWRGDSFEVAEPNRSPNPKPSLFKTYLPIGPIAVFGASNFPFAYSTAGGDTASAFAAGCPVIVKSHPMHAGTGEMVASAISNAVIKNNLPKGIFSNLNAQGYQVGAALVSHPMVKGVGFTGSITGGRALLDISSKRPEPIPVFAEMGSVNPVVVSNGALQENMKQWVQSYADSITNGTGQFCTNPGLIMGLEGLQLNEFISELSKEIDSRKNTVMLNPSIANSFKKLRNDVLSQQDVKQESTNASDNVNYGIQTIASVSGKAFIENPKLHHEVFGPFSLVVKCKDLVELEQTISSLEGQLTATLIATSNEFREFESVISTLSNKVGRIVYNGVPTGVEVTQAMTHGGPFPASTDSRFTAVGTDSIKRWLRPITFQNFPKELLPSGLVRM